MFLIVGRLDDGNADDGRTVDVDIELGYVVSENVGNNEGTSDGIDELNKVGLKVGKGLGASLRLIVGDTLGTKDEDGMIEEYKDGVVVGFRVGREVGMDDVMQDGTAVVASLGV